MRKDVEIYVQSDSLYELVNEKWGGQNDRYSKPITYIQTHFAKVYLAGDIALKIKLPVKYSYINLSDSSNRYECLKNEFRINSETLPEIYLGIAGFILTDTGLVTLLAEEEITDPSGVLEWCLVMKRFDENDVLDKIASRQGLSENMVVDLGDSIARYHHDSEKLSVTDGADRIAEVISELELEFQRLERVLPITESRAFISRGRKVFSLMAELLTSRGKQGFIRKCHGDLHLRNIVMFRGQPVPFDALEFDERLRTIDTLYDLSFLLMDFDHQLSQSQENLVFNRYLLSSDRSNYSAVKLVPLFMFCRSGIRAVALLKTILETGTEKAIKVQEARHYLYHGLRYLAYQKPAVICIGGFSGSGKSTIAKMLVNEVCQSPGAILIRSDSERKHMFGVDETDDLSADHYTKKYSNMVYQRLLDKVKLVCRAGYPAVVDATFLTEMNRQRIQELVQEHRVAFYGFWLMAPVSVMMDRIIERGVDASNATVSVLKMQLNLDKGRIEWTPIDTSAPVQAVSSKIISRIRETAATNTSFSI